MVYTNGTHIVATTLDELHRFAEQHLKFPRRWFQGHNPNHPHYDTMAMSKKIAAIVGGAVKVSPKQIIRMFKEGELEKIKIHADTETN